MKKFETILYLRTDYTEQKVVAGGSVAHTLGVIKGMLRNGFKVICAVATMRKEVKDLQPYIFRSLERPSLPYVPWRLVSFLSNFWQFFQLNRLFKKSQIDCIYQRYGLMNCVGAVLSWYKRIPFILEYNGSEVWVDLNWGGGSKWKKLIWLSSAIEKFNLRRAQSIIVVSQALADDLIARGIAGEKILVNPNGVDIEQLDPAHLKKNRGEIRAEYGIEKRFVFGFIGSFSIWHGIDMLGKMIPKVVALHPEAHFLLIGEGPLKCSLQETLKEQGITQEKVTFTGAVPQAHGPRYLAACDAFLSPTQPNNDGTRFFGSPTKVFEYMSMAKPMIVSDLEQLSQLVRPALFCRQGTLESDSWEKSIGILVSPKDEQSFVAACTALIKSEIDFRENLGQNARQRVENRHTWDHHVKKIFSFVKRDL